MRDVDTAVIAAAGTDSSVIGVGNGLVSGLGFPSDWTTSAVTFEACDTVDGTFVPVYNSDGTEVSIAGVAASRWYALEPQTFAGVPFLKIIAGTTQVNAVDITVTKLRALPRHG